LVLFDDYNYFRNYLVEVVHIQKLEATTSTGPQNEDHFPDLWYSDRIDIIISFPVLPGGGGGEGGGRG
jgi:hypothetical protein